MISTTGLRKFNTTRGFVPIGGIVDGYRVTDTEFRGTDGAECRLYFQDGGGWGPWGPSDREISYHI